MVSPLLSLDRKFLITFTVKCDEEDCDNDNDDDDEVCVKLCSVGDKYLKYSEYRYCKLKSNFENDDAKTVS